MAGFACFVLFFHFLLLAVAQEDATYSDKFIMKTNLSYSEINVIAARNGFELKKKMFDGYYLLKRREVVPRMSKKPISLPTNNTLERHPMIEIFEQEKYLKRYKRQAINNTENPVTSGRIEPKGYFNSSINDNYWNYMWYLQTAQTPGMKVYEAWSRGYTGSGVTVAFLDDGVETSHSDLKGNFNTTKEPCERYDLSYNYIYDKQNPEHSWGDDGHGSMCAGIVSAVKNNECVLGVAYNTNFAALKTLDDILSPTSSDEAQALTHKSDYIDIYSNSWGPIDDGDVYDAPNNIVEMALQTGVFEGRNGKGSIYVFSAGNGKEKNDDCNCDGYVNSIYTIPIGSLSNTCKPAYYSEPCTAVMATAYGGDYPNPMIVTTNRSNTCTKKFQGTSASAPVATGIIALTLEANPDLTWRDVMHLIVETSSNAGLIDPEGFTTNDASKKVSRYHGFGLMNADAMISRALTWKTVPDQIWVSETDTSLHHSSYGTARGYIKIHTHIKHVEHVTVRITFKINVRGNAIFHLKSPQGTRCKLLGSRPRDRTRMYEPLDFTFSSVHTWGENPEGLWKLEMTSSSFFNLEVEIHSWTLTIYGTLTDPLKGRPTAGSHEGGCLSDNSCIDDDHCCNKNIHLCLLKDYGNCERTSVSVDSSILQLSTSSQADYWFEGDSGYDSVAKPRLSKLFVFYVFFLMAKCWLHV